MKATDIQVVIGQNPREGIKQLVFVNAEFGGQAVTAIKPCIKTVETTWGWWLVLMEYRNLIPEKLCFKQSIFTKILTFHRCKNWCDL